MLAQSTRPKCKADTYYIPMADGVYLRGNKSRLILKGKSLYPLLEHLVPNLNGNITLEELTGGLDADRKRMITSLIEKLFAHHFLKDASLDQLHTLLPLELETHASNIAFVESFQTSAAYRFEGFCHKQFLLIGSGLGCISLVQATLQSGAKKITVMVTPEDEADANVRQDVQALCANSSSEVDARLLDGSAWESEAALRATLQSYDAILHIAERPMLARAQLLNRLCVEQQKTLIQAICVDEQVWIGPLVCPETGACWECAWRRLQAALPVSSEQLARSAFDDQPQLSGAGSLLTGPTATMVANRLLFALFQHFTQTSSSETANRMSAFDLATLLSESHAFLPHPHCLACQHPAIPTAAQFLEQIQRLRQQTPVDPDALLENFAGCVDEKLGLFTKFDNGRFVQAPLAVYKVQLSNLIQHAPLSIVAVSTDTRKASTRAVQKACECYAAHCVDQWRLLPSESLQCARTWALDLQTQEAVLVPADHVFAAQGEQARGIAAGQTWEEALCQALLDWCNCLTIEHMQKAEQAYPQVDLERVPLSSEGAHLYRLLQAAGEQIAVYDVTGPLCVPTFATCSGGKIVAYSTHYDSAQALTLGLEQALQGYQSTQFQQPDYALAPVQDFPAHLRSTQLSIPGYTLPNAWPARLEWLLKQLQASGLRVFVIPLDHDPALTRVFPLIIRVLVSGREWEKGE